MITSYAEIRSVATKRRVLSSTSYRSRTLPRAMRGRDPWRSVVVREEAIVRVWEILEAETRSERVCVTLGFFLAGSSIEV